MNSSSSAASLWYEVAFEDVGVNSDMTVYASESTITWYCVPAARLSVIVLPSCIVATCLGLSGMMRELVLRDSARGARFS
jgi:hypothetical protein